MWEGLLPYQIITKVIMGSTPDTSVVKSEKIKVCNKCFLLQDKRPTMKEVLKFLVN